MKNTLIASLFGLLILPATVMAHKEDYLDETFVYQTMEEGVLALEYRSRYFDRSEDRQFDSYWNNSLFVEYGLAERTMIEVRSAWGTPESDDQFAGGFAQLRHRFGNEGDYFIDPAFAIEYETERENDTLKDALTGVLILSKDIGSFNMTLNYAKPYALGSSNNPEDKKSFGIRYPSHGIRWSIEYKDLGKSKRYVLPAVQLPITHGVPLKLGVGKGVNNQSPRYLAAALLEIEFGEEDD
jgi:hypothetical protein